MSTIANVAHIQQTVNFKLLTTAVKFALCLKGYFFQIHSISLQIYSLYLQQPLKALPQTAQLILFFSSFIERNGVRGLSFRVNEIQLWIIEKSDDKE